MIIMWRRWYLLPAHLCSQHLRPRTRTLRCGWWPLRSTTPEYFSIFLGQNRRDIGKSQSIWTDFKMETAGSPLDDSPPAVHVHVAPGMPSAIIPSLPRWWARVNGGGQSVPTVGLLGDGSSNPLPTSTHLGSVRFPLNLLPGRFRPQYFLTRTGVA
eukprot:COSAG01_NODE_7336_length_3244_cov_18.910970_3_plen_156_part_00